AGPRAAGRLAAPAAARHRGSQEPRRAPRRSRLGGAHAWRWGGVTAVNPAEWPREVWVNGRIVGRSEAAVSVEDRGFQFGDGIAAITVTDSRWGHVNVKSLALQPNVLAKRRALRAGTAEAIFIRDGHVTDCTASNPFFVFGGQVRTPPESNYILSGITREVALELCRQEGIPCVETGVLDTELARADEAFLTGTSDEITPAVRIDGQVVGDGKPDPIAGRLADAFRRATRGWRRPAACHDRPIPQEQGHGS